MRSMLFALAAVALASTSLAAQERPRTTIPVLIKEVKPEYTDAARARKVQGAVELTLVVLADGAPAPDIRVTRSLDPDLDQQAIKAARQWRFKPGTKDGQPVPVQVSIEMTFTLRDRPGAARASQSPVYKVGEDGVKSPVLVKEVQPRYTDDAKARHVEGVVELSAVVKADGTIADGIQIIKSLDDQLDQQAILALKQWEFRPGTKDGTPVNVRVNVEMTFTVR